MAKTAWDKLKLQLIKHGTLAIVGIHKKLYTIRVTENTDLEEHIRTIRTLADELAMLDAPITDFQLALHVLASLPASFSPCIAGIDLTDQTKVDPESIIARILEYDYNIKRDDVNSQAAFWTPGSKPYSGKQQKPNQQTP